MDAQYSLASEALRHGNPEALGWFPEGTYPPALPFVGAPPPRRPPWPPTRRIKEVDGGTLDRGEIPMREIPATTSSTAPEALRCFVEPRTRGQPP